jgi:hypothetical protein
MPPRHTRLAIILVVLPDPCHLHNHEGLRGTSIAEGLRHAMILMFLIHVIHIAIKAYGVLQSQRACAML